MNTVFRKNIEFRLSVNGLVIVLALFLLYGLSCIIPATVQLYKSDFSSICILLALSIGISAIWMTLYCFLDRLQREPILKAASTFLCSVATYFTCFGMFSWIMGSSDYVVMKYVFLPLLAFLIVFSFYVIKLDSFDELVDSFIYGAFIGVGVAFSACCFEFMQSESLGLRFVILKLVTRVSVYAAICALGGFLFHQSILERKKVLMFLSFLCILILFSVEQVSEYSLQKNLIFANIKILPILLSFFFIVIVVIGTVFLIHRVLKKVEMKGDIQDMGGNNKFLSYCTIVLSILVLFASLVYRSNTYKTTSFVSQDGAWKFRLPMGYEEKAEISKGSIFNIAPSRENVSYKNSSTDIWIDFNSKAKTYSEIDAPSYYFYGWTVKEDLHTFIAKDEGGYSYVTLQYMYLLKRGDAELSVDVYTRDMDEKKVKNTVRIFIKTLEEIYE